MTNLHNDLILVGATGRLGSSILKTNSVTYGICSLGNPLQGKKIDNLSHPLLGSLLEIPKDKLIITASVVSCRKNMIFVEGNIKNTNQTLIAESKGIWFVKR